MRRGLPIYTKVLGWLLVNVALLAVIVLAFLRMEFHMSLDWMLAGPAGERISMIGDRVRGDLSRIDESEWAAALKGYEKTYGVTFALFDRSGAQVAGPALKVPDDFRQKLSERKPLGERPAQRRQIAQRPASAESSTTAADSAATQTGRPPDAPPKPRFMQRTGTPARYWAGIHVDLTYGLDFRPLTLVMVSDTITGGGLFIDLRPWASLAAACLAVSALVWLPFVRGVTRALSRLNVAARTIAEGNFRERVPEHRNDELGELSSSINAMAAQLGDYVEQQRRITADVAHELCSPIARMQMALGVIEQRATPEQSGYITKIDSELQHMAKLVEEVLSFTKSGRAAEPADWQDLRVRDIAERMIAREAEHAGVRVDVPDDLMVHAPREPLERAVANILRNAVRYAAQDGPIELSAGRRADAVEVVIRDHGPGVPADALEKIFDAFYRIDPARARSTGGAGLGLAIVKRCMATCGGTARAELASPGLRFVLTVPDGGGVIAS